MHQNSTNGATRAHSDATGPIDFANSRFAPTKSTLVVERIPTTITTPLPPSTEIKARRWGARSLIASINEALENAYHYVDLGGATPARAGVVRALTAHELLVKTVSDDVLGKYDHVSSDDWETLRPLTDLIEVTTRSEPRWHITIRDEDGDIMACGGPYSPEIDGGGDFPAAATLTALLDLIDGSRPDVLLHFPERILGDSGELPERLELTFYDISTDEDWPGPQ